jgi:hypothetical protein
MPADPTSYADKIREASGYLALGWCRGSYARNACGQGVPHFSPTAVSWCGTGALFKAGAPNVGTVHKFADGGYVPFINDAADTTQDDMIMLLLLVAEIVEDAENERAYAVDLLRKSAGTLALGWCQGAYARDLLGNSLMSQAESAVTWCAFGALGKNARQDPDPFILASEVVEKYVKPLQDDHLQYMNDDRDTAPGDMEMFLLFVAEAVESEDISVWLFPRIDPNEAREVGNGA